MRLVKLEMTDFLNHPSTVIEFDPITLITGPNNAGKSAIVDALEMVLTGTARYTDRAGRDAAPVVRAGRASFWVSLEVELAGEEPTRLVISRSKGTASGHSLDITPVGGEPWQGGPKRLQEALHRTLGADSGAIRACLHAWTLPRLKPEEQEELILDYLGLRFDLGDIERFLQAAGATPADCGLLYGGPRDAFLEVHPKADDVRFQAPIFDEAYTYAYEKRRQAKRDLQTATGDLEGSYRKLRELSDETPKLAEADEASPARMREALDELKTRHDELLQDKGKSAVKGTGGLIPEKIEAAIEELESWLATRLEWEKRYEELVAGGDLDGQIATCNRSIELWSEQVEDLNAEITAIEVTIEAFEGEPICPITGAKCEVSEEVQAKTLKSLRAKLTRRRKKREEHGDGEEMAAIRQHLVELRDEKPLRGTSDQLVSEIELKRTQLSELEAVPDTSEIDAELEPLKVRIDRGHEKIRAVKTYLLVKKTLALNRGIVDGHRAKVEAWERLVAALGPDGAKLKAVDKPLQELESRLAERMVKIAPGHELAFRTEAGFEIVARAPGTEGEWIGLKGLSTSEALRIGVAIAMILAELSGLRIMVVDNLEWLVGDAKNALAGALFQSATSGILSSVVILKSVEDRPIPRASRRTYWIEDGKAEVIE